MADDISPKWARELVKFLAIKPQFVVTGNIHDVYPAEAGGGVTTLKLMDYLTALLKGQGYALVLSYEPVYGFRLLHGDEELCLRTTGIPLKAGTVKGASLIPAAETIERTVNADLLHTAVIVNFSSRLADLSGNDCNEFFFRLFRHSLGAAPRMAEGEPWPRHNPVLWVFDKENDIPPWYTIDNSRVRHLPIPRPDYLLRRIVAESLARSMPGFEKEEERKRDDTIGAFVDQTGGLQATEVVAIVSLARREGIPFPRVAEAIRMYKLGITENPWSRLDMGKISRAGELLQARVKGQELAVTKSSDIIKRAVFNLAGAQFSTASQRPKGVLFLAGPTGVGKTELAKAITELLFGTETSNIRFDMSEFAHEHADQRLVGAPPGYVGYDAGGQLVNAVRQNPFSVILFDEIEKAHPRILDIFLQILDDGRLTSGRGETAWFSESLIIFTSNLGIYEMSSSGEKRARVSPAMPFAEISASILDAINDFFIYRIGRPEILNRIGNNIVVFDFIREETARRICEKMLHNVVTRLADQHGIAISFEREPFSQLVQECCRDLVMGGRGIGNCVEQVFVNPLSRALFDIGVTRGSGVVVAGIHAEGELWSLKLRKK
jgi:energy-coupling factor transporter ATP-binding protein EcfA2